MAEKMAASSGGVEWSSVLKPFLSHRYETSNRNEILEFCSTIIKCESEILRHKDTNRKFYENFVVLSADYISSCTAKLPVSQIDTVSAACRVLLKYLVHSLHVSCGSDPSKKTTEIETLLNAVRVLCIGTEPLSSAEISVLVDTMKGENLPTHTNPSPSGAEKDITNKPESPRSRTDLSMDIFERLTLPLRDHQPGNADYTASDPSSAAEPSNNTGDPATEINKLFLRTNTESLQALRAGDTLVDLCLSLPTIKKARSKVEDALAGKPFSVPCNQNEATVLKGTLPANISEIKLALSAINLPVLEPLTPTKLDKLSSLSMSVLYIAVGQASANAILSSTVVVSPKCSAQTLKEEDFDVQCVNLVEEALNMYSYIGTTIKSSTRAGAPVYQNHLLAGAWVLISSLQAYLTSTTVPEKKEPVEKGGRSPSKSRETTNPRLHQKFQQSFGVLSVAIATKALSLLTELFEDLHLEACGGASMAQVDPAPLAIMGQFTALQRVARVLSAAPLNNFLFYLAIVSYGKACTLKRLDPPPEGDNFSQSDCTIYDGDMILVSDESTDEDDDDSEPILGQWFEETLAPPDLEQGKGNVEKQAPEASPAPEKGEAHWYITLATNIFVFLNKHFLCTKSAYVTRYVKAGLTEQQMIILAAIIRDLDRETSRLESGALVYGLGPEFSSALSSFTHNLVTNNNLNSLQACLLNHLGVSPWNTDVPHGWPLQVYPRTLAVLAQVLLLRPQNEKEASVINIWHRLVNTLIENVLNAGGSEQINEDLNVEHAQILLYLFHSLNLMQKKSVLLLLAGGLLRCSEISRGPLKDSQLLHLSRLLLLFDYIMKHLYDAPTQLLEQIQNNLFHTAPDKDLNRYTTWQDIEDNYRKITSNEYQMRPRFYVLTSVEVNNQDAPKLDGLACNFILGTPDKLRYPLLVDALIEILNVTHIGGPGSASKMSFMGLCATQYCFTICWRLLQLLPPSVNFMERLAAESFAPGPLLLYSLIWVPRIAHKNFTRWLKDSLGKQGLYTQSTDKIVKTVGDCANNLKFDVNNCVNCILALTPPGQGVITKEHLPPLWNLCLLDALLAKVHVSFEESDGEVVASLIQDLFPHVLRLTHVIMNYTRWSLVHATNQETDGGVQDALAIASTRNPLTNNLTAEMNPLLPPFVTSMQEQWNATLIEDLPNYQNDIIPSESYILKIIDTHIATLSHNVSPFLINPSLRRFLQNYVRFICDHAPKIENTDTKNKAVEMLVGVTLDLRSEYLYDLVSKTLDKMIGDTETDEHQKRVYLQVLDHTYNLVTSVKTNSTLNEQILHSCFKFYEKIIEKASGRQALETFFANDKDLVELLLSVSSQMTQQYSTRVLQFFNKLFQAAEKSSTDPSLNYLCSSMNKLADVESVKLQSWLRQIIIGVEVNQVPVKGTNKPPAIERTEIQENCQLLQALTSFIVKQTSNVGEEVPLTLLRALVPLATYILSSLDGLGFTDLMQVMTMLADAGNGKGHMILLPATTEWVEVCNKYVSQKDTQSTSIFEAGSCVLEYISDVVNGVVAQTTNTYRPLSPPWEGEIPLDCDPELQDEHDVDDSGGEDSDEESLCNKLCTFTVTQKEFMNQHWYHCHTCHMLDGVGVCSVCARVCHKGHDLSYAKYGNFFCDCGAKTDSSCQALVKRQGVDAPDAAPDQLTSSLRRRTSSPVTDKVKFRERRQIKQIHGSKDFIREYLSSSTIIRNLIDFLTALMESIEVTCAQNSPVGCYSRALQALQQLHVNEKKYLHTDQLVLGTVGTQEGAFENVRMSFAGEQGQTIRQLLSAHIIRRVVMCCMTSTHGRRQHLAVAHEKGKITVLQLSALLKQNDSTTRKLTLTKLGSAPIPFTVLSLTSNLCNEDFLAVCGLKDCHILTFNTSGTIADHLVLHHHLETGNFIIKALWLPGSQTQLALVTADFVKIYDLAKDASSPTFYFLVPSGKIRDCTFMYEDGTYHILLMSSPGHIYTEVLNEDSSAKHGSFYVTNTLEVFHLDVTDVNGQVAGGGVSIYYSHTLGLLFYSYVQGKNFISPISPKNNCLTVVFRVSLPQAVVSTTKSNGTRNPAAAQPLCQWTEIPNHPGLVCCALQSSNNPVILMIKPDVILIQEIKMVPPKTKIMDMVAIRHTTGNEPKTTLMLLCEDGSLKMSVANLEKTGFWMSAAIQPNITAQVLKPKKKKKKVMKVKGTGGSMSFPVDFFEHCQVMNDVEIGGNDLLQIYNVAQLKHRLNATGLYVACNKPLGFTMEITNPDANLVMVGIRVMVGSQESQRAPSFIDIYGRIVSLAVTRCRWYDVPLTREESQQADKKLSVLFGPSQDPESLTVIDSIRVYGKTKDAFGWPEENEEGVVPSSSSSNVVQALAHNGMDSDHEATSCAPLTKLEKLVVGILEALDGSFLLTPSEEKLKSCTLKIATQLLTLPTPPLIQIHSKALLASLHSSRQLYYTYKDQALLQHVLTSLNAMTEAEIKEIDAESFYRLILIVRGIAVARPQNLVKFSDSHTGIQDVILDDPLDPKPTTSKVGKGQHLLLKLMDVLWILHSLNPDNGNLAPVVVTGLKHTEQVIHALVEIVHAFNSCDTYSNITVAVYLQLLLSKDCVIAFSARQALQKVLKSKVKRRRVFIPSPPHCNTPLNPVEREEVRQEEQQRIALGPNALEALLGEGAGGVGYQPLLDIPPDADDETMVELAIALSLQEHDLVGVPPVAQPPETGAFSDTTASAGGSDDEGSTAATDGSTLRTSPAEQGGGSAAGSESGGSGVESINEHNVSGRSSAYGDSTIPEALVSRSDTSTVTNHPQPEVPEENDVENSSRLHVLRLQLLERLTEYLPKLRNVDGIRAIPFLQVVLQLTADLDGHSERDRACFNALLTAIIIELQLTQAKHPELCTRTHQKEVQLVLMKLLSVFMGRKNQTGSKLQDNSSFVARATATLLHKASVIPFCNNVLEALLTYWQNHQVEETKSSGVVSLLKEHSSRAIPDMTPFFMKQFVKEHSPDFFNTYPEILTEMALRLPYLVHKYSEIAEPVSNVFNESWYHYLCEYMMTSQVPYVRRQVRKLLLFICGNKEKYRYYRDIYALNRHLRGVIECCNSGGFDATAQVHHSFVVNYDILVELVEHLKSCVEIAAYRTGNWQKFCINHQDSFITVLIQMSCLLDKGVAPTILHLLQYAIVNMKKIEGVVKPRKEAKSTDESEAAVFEEANAVLLVEQINRQVQKPNLVRFIKTFMLNTNTTSVRWQAHTLILAIYNNSKVAEQESLLELLWGLWPLTPSYGKKASQFVDLLGYFSLKFFQTNNYLPKVGECVEKAVNILRAQNELLAHHPNANLYAHMSQFVDLEGYYLESEPCLVCNNPEVAFTMIKLSSLKVDSKFTTTTQIVKLLNSHIISKITVRIGDLKRSKMVRTINIYYNNRAVQAIVELKNKPNLWHKAKKVSVQSGQTEVKIEFLLPVVACNLMIEYAEFYENIQASSETLQCPRCSAAVPANPGVCANCGENVFQCHKCRAINYDEKDPFLCHACGFCKYAKFDFTLLAKPCCAIEPIESDEDRKKTVGSINSLLEKADRVYKLLIANKPNLEGLVLKITEQRTDRVKDEGSTTATSTPPQTKVNKTIQLLAQQYCNDCKASFEELSKIIQRVLVSRKELVAYDWKHREYRPVPVETTGGGVVSTRCYGCSTAATEHSLTLLRALASNPSTREVLCSKGLIQELVWNNLRKGSSQIQDEVKLLLCVLTRDNPQATEELCNLLMNRISLSLNGHVNTCDLGTSVRHEISLLAAMVQKEDDCWELNLRCMMKLFLKACLDSKNPLVMESIILPCLKILQGLMKGEKKSVEETIEASIDVYQFLNKTVGHSFAEWRSRYPVKASEKEIPTEPGELRAYYLSEKYLKRWRERTHSVCALELDDSTWLKSVLFNSSSRLARQVACSIVELMFNTPKRKKEILVLLTCFLEEELGSAGESSAEFLTLYQSLIQEVPWKQFLTIQGVLIVLGDLITNEIAQLHYLEATTLTSDLAQGFVLSQLTELLASFLDDRAIRRQYKGRLVGAVLNGYLSLRRLVVQRTRSIDDTQEKLLELLEEMTTGTEEETKSFMAICIETVEKYSVNDILTPVFIFERLCSIIYAEENDVDEFFLTLEKDPQQEDFLQGRMLGRPYSSSEPGMGPLMRDIKNKICQDCELVALLEDDNGMELLVNNKIISLDLPVKDVFKKIWVAEGGYHDAMRVVYRMRGLLGDATEEFIEVIKTKTQHKINNEEVYKMANVLAECSGLTVMVKRLAAIQNVWRAKPLLQVLLKLFRLAIKVTRCQEVLIEPELGAMTVFLKTLQMVLESEPDPSQASVTDQLLDIMEAVLSKATMLSLDDFIKLSEETFGGVEYISALLNCSTHPSVKNNQAVLVHLTRVLAGLAYCNEPKMVVLMDYFKPVLDLNRFDFEHSVEQQQKLEMLCVLANGIERNQIGNVLKDYIVSHGVVRDFLEYITMHAPCVKPTLLRTDSDDLKDFISKSGLKYCLRVLTGLADSHENTQLAVAESETIIPIIHRLEQVSSDEHVGSLAENLLEALLTNGTVAKQIEQARDFTRSEKKRLAMAMREKQLGQLGMRTNDKGQVTAKSPILRQFEDLGEETGLVCCICREGYKYQPTKVLGIYTFTKRCNVEEFETKPRRSTGYTTVSHFNVVHIDCHMSAVRLARARDEWESAALQNANTKCNGLLPLWGPQVPESAFASCLARHNSYLQESTNHRDIGHGSTIHDLKLLLLRFAQEKPFHENTGGGGPQSNLHMVPYIIHIALYVVNTTRVSKREEAALVTYLTTMDKWVEAAYEAEGPLYWATLSVLLHSTHQWSQNKVEHLKRLIVLAQVRHCHPSGPVKSLSDREVKDYGVYKPYLVFFALVDGIYSYFFKGVAVGDWSTNLADFIRHNDEVLMKGSERLLAAYMEEILPSTSFSEFCDVTGLLDVIPSPDSYISDLLKELP